MSVITRWLNTSPTKATVWLKSTGTDVLGDKVVFLNIKSAEERTVLVEALRGAFKKNVSYLFDFELSKVTTSKNGSLQIETTLAKVIDGMREAEKAPSIPADEKAVAKAKAILAEINARPAVNPNESVDIFDD